MSERNLFEAATRLKLRFPTSVGLIAIEDLWDLPLISDGRPSLNSVAQAINTELKAAGEENFVETRIDKRKVELELKLEIVKHIIAIRQEEAEKRSRAAANLELRRKIEAELAQRQNQALGNTSTEELQKQLDALAAEES